MFRFIFRRGEELFEEEVLENGHDSERLLSIGEELPTNGKHEKEPEEPPIFTDLMQVDLVRYSKGAYDILGKLYFKGHFQCFTLEGNLLGEEEGIFLPEGVYEIVLREGGGKNVAYAFRYKNMHQGMLQILRGEEFPYAYLHEGNTYTDRRGSILLGKIPLHEKDLGRRRELWFSNESYAHVYPEIAGHLLNGGKVQLWIREEFQPLLPNSRRSA